MFLIFKIFLAASLILILIQDIKDRLVYWFLFPFVGFIGFLLLNNNIEKDILILSLLTNITIILTILITLYCYSKIKLKKDLNSVFGLGDLLMIACLAFCFTSETYLILLVFSFIFSLIINVVLKNKDSIPLAGHMALFFLIVYLLHWCSFYPNLYL